MIRLLVLWAVLGLVLLAAVAVEDTSRADPMESVQAAALAATPPAKAVAPAYVPGRILLKRRQGVQAAAVEALAGIRLERKLLGGAEQFAVAPGSELAEAERLTRSGLVEYAEPDYLRYAAVEPNDPLYPQQWALPKINAPAAWAVVTGSTAITVAVVDTGVLATHPDLAGKVLPGRNFTGVLSNTNATDDNGHGTHVAGIAAAVTNNAVGVAGVSWGARILPVKVLDSTGGGENSDVAEGIIWAADQGARIINLSLGGGGYSQVLANAVAYAQGRGSLVIAAMGNFARGLPSEPANPVFYPAAYPEVVAVAATDSSDSRGSFSNYHDHTWVAAPGVSILSTVPTATTKYSDGTGYRSLSGTSMATPYVSGLAALIWSAQPGLTADEVRHVLQQAVADVGDPGWDQETGWGRIDAARAVTLTTTTTRLKGRVLNAAGLPAASATVTADTGTTVTSTVTGGDGRFDLSVAGGTYTVSVTASGAGSLPARTGVVVEPGGWAAADFVVPPASNAIANGGFDSGTLSGWTVITAPPPSPRLGVSGPGPVVTTTARSGGFGVRLGFSEDLDGSLPVDYTSDVKLRQTVTVPASGYLSFWYRLETVDNNPDTPCWYDCFTMTVRSLAGQPLATVLETNQGSGWRNVRADIGGFSGQQVTVEFWLHSDPNLTTAVWLDEVALGLPAGMPPPTATPTPTITATPTQSSTPTITPMPTSTPSPSATATMTPTSTTSPTPTPTSTATPTPTVTPSPSLTPTPVPTATAVPASAPVLTSIEPNNGSNTVLTFVTIRGANFRSGARVALARDGQSFPLTDVTVSSATTILAEVPTGLSAGLYDVVVTNSDGLSGQLLSAFTVVSSAPVPLNILPPQGMNNVPNDVTIDGHNYRTGITVALQDSASPVILTDTQRLNSTRVQAVVPPGLDPGVYDVVLRNPGAADAGRLSRAYTALSTANDDFFVSADDLWTNPTSIRRGSVVQLGLTLHRRGGQTSVQVPVRFYLGDPAAGGTLIGETTSVPIPPATEVESVFVSWPVGDRQGTVNVSAIVDPGGSLLEATKANNRVSRSLTILPSGVDTSPPEITNVLLNGGAIQTNDPQVTVAVNAVDGPGGTGVTTMYIVEREFNAAARAWVPIQATDWVTYVTPYVLTLTDRAGIRYIQAYVADAAGNISLNVFKRQIDYVPASDSLRANQVRLYRRTLSAGDTLSVRVEPTSGDADLYVWGPSGNAVLIRNASGATVDEGILTAPEAGVYQVEVVAYTDTTYRLGIVGGRAAVVAATSETGSFLQPNVEKTTRMAPVVPVNSEPEGRSAVPVAPLSAGTSGAFLPLVLRAHAGGW